MDHYTREAYIIARDTILENIDRLEKYGKQGSGDVHNIKNWRRFGSAFAWDPEVFESILENPNASSEQLMKMLRKTESDLMKKMGVIHKIPLHHKYANRTGGDISIRADVDVMDKVREILANEYNIRGGNSPYNLNPAGQFDELGHLNRPGASGSVFAKANGTRDPRFPHLHRRGQDLLGKLHLDTKIINGGAHVIVNALLPSMMQQRERFEEATNHPRTQYQRSIITDQFPQAFDANTPMEEIIRLKPMLKALGLDTKFAEGWDGWDGNAYYNSGLGTGAYKQIKNYLTDNIGGEATGALYGLLLDPAMQQAVDNKDGGKVTEILATDAAIGGLVNFGLKSAAKAVPAIANVAATAATVMNTALPIAAVSQLQGSSDSQVQEFRNQESLEAQNPQAIERSQFVPQQYGKQGPEITPQGEVISEPAPMIDLTPMYENVVNYLNGGVHIKRKKLERQEQLITKPVDAPERENALSVGFAGGM